MSDATILSRLATLEARVAALESGPGRTPTTPGKAIADDEELDSSFGNPVVRKDPTKWDGPSYAGCRMSECPPKYLRLLASKFDYMAKMADEEGKTWTNKEGKQIPASTFSRKDAARARGWALRNEKRGVVAPSDAPASVQLPAFAQSDAGVGDADESEIPF